MERTGKRKRVEGKENETGERDRTVVADDEVEEFFAILQRMRDASCRIQSEGNRTAARWRPVFEMEDFQIDKGVTDRPIRTSEPVPRQLDLNAEPEP